MKVLSLFSGIGAFEKALTNMGVNYELVNYCEIDKYASKSYAAIHNVPESKNLVDITKVDTSKLPNDIDLLTYGFPCQDISAASGNPKGLFNDDGTHTRSGLFFEALRIIDDCQPKIAICENVKNLTSNKFKKEFQIVLESLESAGYKNYWQVLKSSDYGIPQARERVFIVSVRKDINKGYTFPEPFDLERSLLDFISFRDKDNLTAAFYNYYRKAIDSSASYCDFVEYVDALPVKRNEIHTKNLNMYSFNEMNAVTMLSGICGTLTCRNVINYNKKFWYNKKLYRPSPLMCWRLQGFDDEDYYKASKVVDESYLWKQAGNSITVDVVEEIYEQLFRLYWNEIK